MYITATYRSVSEGRVPQTGSVENAINQYGPLNFKPSITKMLNCSFEGSEQFRAQ